MRLISFKCTSHNSTLPQISSSISLILHFHKLFKFSTKHRFPNLHGSQVWTRVTFRLLLSSSILEFIFSKIRIYACTEFVHYRWDLHRSTSLHIYTSLHIGEQNIVTNQADNITLTFSKQTYNLQCLTLQFDVASIRARAARKCL